MRDNITRKLFIIAILLIQVFVLRGQPKKLVNEDKLKEQVSQSLSDTARITALLRLANYDKDSIQQRPLYKNKALLATTQALTIAKQINNMVKIGDCYDMLSRIYDHSGDKERAKSTEKTAISFYIQGHNDLLTGKAWKQLAGYFSFEDDKELVERINYTNLALQAFIKCGDKLAQALTYQELGDLYNLHEPAISLQCLKKGLVIYQSIHYKKLQGIYFMLNENYDTMGDYNQAINFGLLAIKAAEDVKDTSTQVATIYNHLAKTYFDMNRLDKASYYYRYGIIYALANHDNDAYTIIAFNLSNTLMKLGKNNEALKLLQTIKNVSDNQLKAMLYATSLDAAILLKRDDLESAYYNKAVSSMQKLDKTDYIRGHVYSAMIHYQFSKKNYEEARKIVNQYAILAQRIKLIGDMANTEHILFRLDSTQGKYLSAIRHNQTEKKLLDTLLDEQKNKSISQLEIEYETEKKERELRLQATHIQLLNKEGQLQHAKLQQAAFLRKVTISGIAMLSILLGLIYSRYRIKSRNNIQLQAQRDIINSKNASLEALVNDKDCLLIEKEWLMKEIHHRVKNNLQIVISLLNTQSIYLQDSEAIDAIRESQHRMQSISLIHQRLYQSENLALIDMKEYICELVQFLKDSFDIRRNIEIITEIEPVSLDVAQAVPIGLILNEALTNSIKYAFPGDASGVIFIRLDEPEHGRLELTIEDNGRGLPDGFEIDKCESLGMSLMKGLCRQIHGNFVLTSHSGLRLKIKIPKSLLLNSQAMADTQDI
jgi:two-component sensor histidine kinase